VCNQPFRPNEPPSLSRMGNDYLQTFGDTLKLGSEGMMAHSTLTDW